MKYFFLIITLIISSNLFSQRFNRDLKEPEYDELYFWSAHPDKDSPAKLVPGSDDLMNNSVNDVDIFFIHPTTYTSKKPNEWNGDVTNAYLNDLTDNRSIKYQASIFNQVGNIYAPRYRQAHIAAYSLRIGENRSRIFDLAYKDVEEAFKHYMKYYNNGKPFIIASHSQGSTHGKRLLKEVIDNSPEIRDKMVIAYLVGMDVKVEEFINIPMCDSPDEVSCFTSWRTIRENTSPPIYYPTGEEYAVDNPLTWDIDEKYGSSDLHIGAVLKRFNKVHYHALEAESSDGILYISKPKVPFGFLSKMKNFHIADYNLFYYNVQANAIRRVKAFIGSF